MGVVTPRVVDLAYPFTGRWLVQNSPANRVPSHGTNAFGTRYAIDFVPVAVDAKGSRMTLRDVFRPAPATIFIGFGRPITAPLSGTVIASCDEDVDHDSFRGLPSLWYAMSQARRAARGWRALGGCRATAST